MKQHKWHYLLISMPCCFLLGILLAQFGATYKQVLLWTVIIATSLLAFAVSFNLIYAQYYRRAQRRSLARLEDLQTEAFLAQTLPLYEKTKSSYMRAVIAINIAAAYADLQQYALAIALLQTQDRARLAGTAAAVFDLNLCTCYYYAGQWDKAEQLYKGAQKDFAVFENHKRLGGHVKALLVLRHIEWEEWAQAQEALDSACARWNTKRLHLEYERLQARLDSAAVQG